jgi:hypothetical protein
MCALQSLRKWPKDNWYTAYRKPNQRAATNAAAQLIGTKKMLLLNNSTRKEIIAATAMVIAQTMLAEPKREMVDSIENALSQPPLPGKIWPDHGGAYMGIMRNQQHYWHLILAVDPMSIFSGAWGAEGKNITGADSFTDGLANTQALIEGGHIHPIIGQLSEYNKIGQDGHTDFYLPAIRENNLINIYGQEHVEKVYHWSSTQHDADGAWSQAFENGYQYVDNKDISRAARAVRRELII